MLVDQLYIGRKFILSLFMQSYNEILKKTSKKQIIRNMKQDFIELDSECRPNRQDDCSDDPIILQPLRVMTSLCPLPWRCIPTCCPLAPRHAAWTVGICLWSRGDAHILG